MIVLYIFFAICAASVVAIVALAGLAVWFLDRMAEK